MNCQFFLLDFSPFYRIGFGRFAPLKKPSADHTNTKGPSKGAESAPNSSVESKHQPILRRIRSSIRKKKETKNAQTEPKCLAEDGEYLNGEKEWTQKTGGPDLKRSRTTPEALDWSKNTVPVERPRAGPDTEGEMSSYRGDQNEVCCSQELGSKFPGTIWW